MRYLKSLDGLRGVAVLFVIAFHYGLFLAGWIGVQIFFVLSGFLITSILLQEKSNPLGFYLKRFYWRRGLRIFPLYYGYLIILTTIVIFWFNSETSSVVRSYLPYLFTYTYNLTRFDAQWRYLPYITHFWSLCVEEQFYLIWPILIYLLPNRWLRWLIGIIMIASPLVRFVLGRYLTYRGLIAYDIGDSIYWFPLSQADAFAAGAAIPIFNLPDRIKRPVPLFRLLVLLTMGLGIANFAIRHRSGLPTGLTSFGYPLPLLGNLQHIWGYTLLNMCSLACILCLLNTGSMAWLFSNRFLVGVGKISYGMYLFHWPILGAFNGIRYYPVRSPRSLGIFIIYLSVVILVSYVSYIWFERRFLALKDTRFEIPKSRLGVTVQMLPTATRFDHSIAELPEPLENVHLRNHPSSISEFPQRLPITTADWAATPPAVHSVVFNLLTQLQVLQGRVTELERQIKQHSGNSSHPHTSD